ncbi:hypothetical protein H4O18_16065 [Arenibacter sp. BSSL-BM3]|uniref:Uncharacterized protein n=1 Tax=Arenibacter arenosicollis TaxID=2762274 RepID=A0ABR7QR11_9FLAO|nr:hypothetical protein [Arenibacter arenosicollis]MBC8769514.1 hypothetical protein [Arenibacter arenosicollis]
MKTKIVLLITVLGLLSISAINLVNDIVAKLGMDAKYAQYSILGNFVGRFDSGPMNNGVGNNSFKVPYAKLLPSIISGDKTGAAEELCVYIKTYINSEEFMASYNELREDAMPLTNSNGVGLTSLKKDLKVINSNIENYPNDKAYVAEQKKLRDETQASINGIMEESKKQFPNKDLWEQSFPANPEVLVKRRLQEYLALAGTVDFSAKLTEPDNYKIRKFVNPAYEKKSLQWKACYRAGKEVNDVFTAFVKEWLNGEIIATVKTKMSVNSSASKENNNTAPMPTTAVAENSTTEVNTATTPQQDNVGTDEGIKAKKSLIGKIKDKAKAVIKD